MHKSSAVNRCSCVAAASLGEQSCQGIWTSRSGRMITSPSRIGLILFAVRTSVTLTACTSKHTLPFLANQIKMIEDDFPHFSLFTSYDWGLIIYDEVHLLPAPVFRITAEIQARRRLGLTATLVREDGRDGR